MSHLRRARLVLICTGLVVIALLVLEFPVSELFHQRAELASTSHEIAVINAQNAELSTTIASLRDNATVSAIAHSDYGLIFPGQISYVVLPSANDVPGEADTLAQAPIPKDDVIAGDANALLGASSSPSAGSTKASGNLWSRVEQRLFFWRWAF
jgi:cell division protein FtsB